jgi:hypothetical protein
LKTLKAFIQESSQNIQGLNQAIQESSQAIQELKNVAISSSQNLQELKQFMHQAIAKMEGEIDYLVTELNRTEEEEFQSQLMARGHYMIDEDESSNSCHEHVTATTIFESEEIVDNNEEEEKEEKVEHIEPVEPSADTSLSNDNEVSTEAHSFIIVPLETHHEPKTLILQCLKKPSYATILKDSCRQEHKSRNHRPKRIFPSKQVGYLRWQNIRPECYQILKKKRWKGLVGHPNDRGRYGNFFFHILLMSYFSFFILFLVILFFELTAINILMFVSMRKYCC